MSHWIVALVILPGLVAPVIALVMRYDLVLQRVFSLAATLALVVMAGALYQSAATGVVEAYELGSWPAPFGIVLVLDRLSGIMVALTAILALVVLAYAVATGWDTRGRHFHALYQFQLMGLFGAMLTSDVFNLFVFFEILLIASYGLMIHGGGRMRLRGGVQYVIYNLAGSTLFLFALGTVYGVLGTLNMADMAVRAAELPEGDGALLRVAAALLLLVFVLKGALLPLHFWLPNTYALAPAPVAALFAIMTKVGAYAVIRVYTLVFHPDLEATGSMAGDAIIPAALVTLVVGMIGVLAGGTVARIVAFAAIGSMGTLFLAIGAFTPQGTAAAIYYLVHSTLAAAVLFLIVDQIRARRGNTALVPLPPMAQNGLIAALFFGGAIAMAGMPPLSGFVGKLLVMDALRDHALWGWIWGAILVTSLIAIVGFARAGSTMFWKAHDATTQADAPPPEARINELDAHVHPGAALASIGAMLGLIIALTVLAGPAMRAAEAAADQLHEREAYIVAVLGANAVPDPVTGLQRDTGDDPVSEVSEASEASEASEPAAATDETTEDPADEEEEG